MGLLTKDQILAADDLPREVVPVPEWGGEVTVRTMTGSERDAFEAFYVESTNGSFRVNVRARVCALAICDETGARLFSDADIEVLGKKSAAALDRVFEAVSKLNGLSKKDVEELEGKDKGAPNSGSGSS